MFLNFSGGLPLTVSGEHLDSVHSPYLLVYVTWRDVNGTAQMEVLSEVSTPCEFSILKKSFSSNYPLGLNYSHVNRLLLIGLLVYNLHFNNLVALL